MTTLLILGILATAPIAYGLGVARGHWIASRESHCPACLPRFDPWANEPAGPNEAAPTPLARDVDAYGRGYQAGYRKAWAAAELTAELRAERTPGVRERMVEGVN